MDTKFQKMEEFVKEAVEALGKEVVECLRRRDKQWTKQLREKNVPEVAVPPPTETDSVPSTICSSSPLTDRPAISTSSPTQDRATEGTTTAMTSTEPAVSYIFSVLPFSSEEIITAQQDDATLSISTSTAPDRQDHRTQPPGLAVPKDPGQTRPAENAARGSQSLDPANATEPPRKDKGESSQSTENSPQHPGGRLVANGPKRDVWR